MSQSQTYRPARWLWNVAKGALIPIVLLGLSIAISLGLGVMAAEDWDGFAGRLNLGKTIAFYISVLIGSGLIFRIFKNKTQRLNTKAQVIGIISVLMLWLIFL